MNILRRVLEVFHKIQEIYKKNFQMWNFLTHLYIEAQRNVVDVIVDCLYLCLFSGFVEFLWSAN